MIFIIYSKLIYYLHFKERLLSWVESYGEKILCPLKWKLERNMGILEETVDPKKRGTWK